MIFQLSQPPLWFVNLTAFCVCITLSSGLLYAYATHRIETNVRNAQEARKALPEAATLATNPFQNVVLTGKAALVYDVSRKKVLFEQNAQAQLPLASLTKLMTAVIATEILPSYTAIEIRPRLVEGDVRLKVGERWKLEDLLSYTLLTSSNVGADSMAAAAASYLGGKGTTVSGPESAYLSPFVEEMNKKARVLGLDQTYFLNPSGLDTDKNTSGAYGSAKDIALLLAYIIENHPSLLSSTETEGGTFTAPDGRKIEAKNTNAYVISVPGIIGSKTGLTDLAGGNLAVAFDASFGEPFIVVILSSTGEERFNDVEKLISATIEYLGTGLKASEETTLSHLPQ